MSTKLPEWIVEKLPKRLFAVGLVALLFSAFFYTQDHHRFYFSYLTSFYFYLSISLGGLFFVLIQHLSNAGWSVVIRRIPEQLMKNIWVLALLFIPILFGLHDLFHWTHADAVAHDPLLQVKEPYLNIPFFLVRVVFYWVVWILLSKKLFNNSIKQDQSGDKNITFASHKLSTYGLILFVITLTFSSIDWLMSITPHWFSTMFGVYIFAGAAVSSLAVISLIAMLLRKYAGLEKIITIEHFHDLGKLLYGFNIFWAYIAFSQYFLIWYANIPEETHWFLEHFHGNWNTVAAVLAIGHFGIPFVLLMSRHVKRNLKLHAAMALWILAMHILDLYWLIMPNLDHHGIHITFVDVTNFVGIGAVFFAVLFKSISRFELYPIKDPRLQESLSLDNH